MEYPLVTVFGGSGFIGRHTVRALAQAGYRIRVAVRRPKRANYLQPMGQAGQIQIVECNVRDSEEVTAAVAKANAVVNLVGVLRQRGRQRFKALHVDAAVRIAKAAMDANATTLVHVSALGASLGSKARYAYSKAIGEARVREEFPAATILRPSLVYGPEDKFFNRFAHLARFSLAIPVVGDGQKKFQPVFVGDVASAIANSVKDPTNARGRTYDLGGPGIYGFQDLLEIMLRETNRKRKIVHLPMTLSAIGAALTQFLPYAPLTLDQVRMLKQDSVIARGALSFDELRIAPTTVEAMVPTYLWRFRPRGQFQPMAKPALA